jgi:hypothetical protein
MTSEQKIIGASTSTHARGAASSASGASAPLAVAMILLFPNQNGLPIQDSLRQARVASPYIKAAVRQSGGPLFAYLTPSNK